MRGIKIVLSAMVAAIVSACYQAPGPVVEQGAAAPVVQDGVYRKDDGETVSLHWDQALGAYRVASGGIVRVQPLTEKIYLADYQAERNIAMLVRRDADGGLTVLVPPDDMEKRMIAQAGLALRAGPVKMLNGDAARLRDYFTQLAASPGLIEAGRLVPVP